MLSNEDAVQPINNKIKKKKKDRMRIKKRVTLDFKVLIGFNRLRMNAGKCA